MKFVIVSWRNLPSVSINDPLLMIGKPAALTAATGMDALTHAVGAYISKDANPVTDAAAMQAIRLIARNLRQAVAPRQQSAGAGKHGLCFSAGRDGFQ